MSQSKSPKKKVVTTKTNKTNKKVVTTKPKKKGKIGSDDVTASGKGRVSKPKYKSRKTVKEPTELVFKKGNFIWMAAGLGLITIGLLLMSGGAMPSNDVWDESIIYSFRRITLAPIFLLAGLALEIVAIFKRF